MEETYDLKDLNLLFNRAEAMHDEVMTHIDIIRNEIRIEYGKIGENELWKPYKKAIVSYLIDEGCGYSLKVCKLTRNGTKDEYTTENPEKVKALNNWNMEMYKFDFDIFGEMTLHFDIRKGKKYRSVELSFTPTNIKYTFEEST